MDVVVHCASGDRSSIAASLLLAKGYSNVINLTGGITQWLQDGKEVLQGSEMSEKVPA